MNGGMLWLLGGSIAGGLFGSNTRENGVSAVVSVRDDVQYYRRKMEGVPGGMAQANRPRQHLESRGVEGSRTYLTALCDVVSQQQEKCRKEAVLSPSSRFQCLSALSIKDSHCHSRFFSLNIPAKYGRPRSHLEHLHPSSHPDSFSRPFSHYLDQEIPKHSFGQSVPEIRVFLNNRLL